MRALSKRIHAFWSLPDMRLQDSKTGNDPSLSPLFWGRVSTETALLLLLGIAAVLYLVFGFLTGNWSWV